MNGLGKGIAIAACALAIAYIAVQLKNPDVCWSFVPVAWMANDWKCSCDCKKDHADEDG